MTPITVITKQNENAQPDRTYRLDMANGCINGFCDGLESVAQAAVKRLLTEKGRRMIYHAEYGLDRSELQTNPQAAVRRALCGDGRIREVTEIAAQTGGDSLSIACRICCTYGSALVESEEMTSV